MSAHVLDEGTADGESQACSLCETVQFDKTSEDAFLFVLRDATSGIGDIEIEFFATVFVTEADTSPGSELDGIGHQIDDQLWEPVLFGTHRAHREAGNKFQLYVVRL